MKSLKLTQIESNSVTPKEMEHLKGGTQTCGCGCLYARTGGSSSAANGQANMQLNLTIPNTKTISEITIEPEGSDIVPE